MIRRRSSRLRVVHPKMDTPPNLATKQEFKDECDLNIIVRRAMKGVAPKWINTRPPAYGDFSETPSLAEAYDKIAAAEEAFMDLPAQLRRELNNDPRNLEHLTYDQIKHYGLGRPQEPLAGDSDPSSSVQDESPGTEPGQARSASKPTAKSTKERAASKQSDQE